jgi:hypothetical protein
MGCVTESSIRSEGAWSSESHTRISVERCTSRRALVEPEIETRATANLEEELAESGVFQVVQGASVIATCDIESFEEGNAFERWIMPGSYPTLAQVAVTLWEQPGDRELVSVRGKAAVREGGLYTIGADRYILGAAMREVVEQLIAWTRDRGVGTP